MKARRVRPGALVRDDEGELQVVVGLRGPMEKDREKAGYRYAAFANGREEWWPPDVDVEVVKLTPAQTRRLQSIAAGYVVASASNLYQDLAESRYPHKQVAGLVALGLTAQSQERKPRDFQDIAMVLTPLGSALLEAIGAKTP